MLSEQVPLQGGATRFASGQLGWQRLDEQEQTRLLKLSSVQSWEVFMEYLQQKDPGRPAVTPNMIAQHPDVIMPLVRRHPATGKHSLYVNAKNTRRVVATSEDVLCPNNGEWLCTDPQI
jgi:taurine dioxygenase